MKTINTAANEGRHPSNSRTISRADAQMELSFDGSRRHLSSGPRPAGSRRQRHLNRALWWFQQMRHVVDLATDWQPAPPPRPEQTWFTQVESRAS
jgi:hypothetical protein